MNDSREGPYFKVVDQMLDRESRLRRLNSTNYINYLTQMNGWEKWSDTHRIPRPDLPQNVKTYRSRTRMKIVSYDPLKLSRNMYLNHHVLVTET